MYTENQIATKTNWVLDPVHSELIFKVKHLMITTVTGHFNSFRVQAATAGNDFTKVYSIIAEADVSSIDTKSEHRDAHLRSEDFFNVEKFALIKFEATDFDTDNSTGRLRGHLTIRDIIKPVTLQVEIGGIVIDPYGNTKAGFTVTGKVSRKEFGLNWNAMTEAGGAVVGDEVKINAEIQLIKQS